jgi:anaerobic ribonucleoside-triphosphate reductase activating protein
VEVVLARTMEPLTALGPGRRFGVWFQGCTIGCPGCMSTHTWPSAGAMTIDVDALVSDVVAAAEGSGLDGVTISGGEPFQQPKGLRALLRALRDRWPAGDVLVYSGYTFGHLRRHHSDVLRLIDALMSGPYVEARPTDLPWRGSANQRLTLLSPAASVRYGPIGDDVRRQLQVTVDRGAIWITGIPRPGELDVMRQRLLERGLELDGVSW